MNGFYMRKIKFELLIKLEKKKNNKTKQNKKKIIRTRVDNTKAMPEFHLNKVHWAVNTHTYMCNVDGSYI